MVNINKKTVPCKRELLQNLLTVISFKVLPKVSIIILAYNNWHITKQCLDSVLYDACYPNLEVIVIDNASTDETGENLANYKHPQLKVFTSTVNLGFAGGNNLGLKQASGEYLILLNNDTIVPQGCIERLITPLVTTKFIGLTGPLTNYAKNEQQVDNFLGCPETGVDKDWLQKLYLQNQDKVKYTHFLVFFCVALRRKVYCEIGEFDENYTIGMFEDNDYCEQVAQSGYRLAIVKDAFVYHHGSVSLKTLKTNNFKEIYINNMQYFAKKWGRRALAHLKCIKRT